MEVCKIFALQVQYLKTDFLDKGLAPPCAAEDYANICKKYSPVKQVPAVLSD